MRDCVNVEFRERLPDLLHDRLEASARTAVLVHVSACEDCAAELELLRGVHRMLGAATPTVDVARIVRAVGSPVPARTVADAGRRSRGRRYGTFGSMALAAGLGALVLLREDLPTTPPAATAPPAMGVSQGVVPTAPARETGPATTQPPAAVAAAAPATPVPVRELAFSEALSEVGDGELAALLDEIDSLDALPMEEPDEPLPTPARVTRPRTGGA